MHASPMIAEAPARIGDTFLDYSQSPIRDVMGLVSIAEEIRTSDTHAHDGASAPSCAPIASDPDVAWL